MVKRCQTKWQYLALAAKKITPRVYLWVLVSGA
jgi:hypothetical protein